MQIKEVTCEYRLNPIGLGALAPRFGWVIDTAAERDVRQTAYHIQVAVESKDWESAIWDTGWVHSDQSVHVEYSGPALQSGTRYRVRVRIQDNHGRTSEWQEAFWMTGKLSPSDWSASWIAGDTKDSAISMLRHTFQVKAPVTSATIFATALGLYELELNGSKVTEDLFTPGWTSYKERLQTQTYDITAMIQVGENAIGALLADGWYSGGLGWRNLNARHGDQRAFLLELELTYADGSSETIKSDGQWLYQNGPILYSHIYHGETYDARLERTGWSEIHFESSDWLPVTLITQDNNILVPQENVPTRITEEVHPVALIHTPNGDTVIDFGQNMVGWVEFTVEGSQGDEIVLQHAEVLDKEGNFYIDNLRSAKQEVRYICKGGGSETYHPRFTFQGFRYVKVVSYPGEIGLDRFVGKVIHSDMPVTGSFECSNPMVNQLQRNIVWGQRGNFLDVPTDCPQRDERLGWTGDAQVFIRTAAFNMHVPSFFTKWLRDLKADQRPDGGVPFVIPDVPNLINAKDHSSSAWGDAAVIIPWTLYLCYGDKRILQEQFSSMKSWVDYIHSQGDDPLLWNSGFHFGDWLALDAKQDSYTGSTPKELIATAFFAYSAQLVSKAAAVLGYSVEAQQYEELYLQVAERFRYEFVTISGRIASPTQTAHVLPLMFNLVTGETRQRVVRDLAELIRGAGNKLTTGFVGTPYLCHVLSENGELELAYKLLLQEEFPSWLFSILQGATTIWEHWDGIKQDGTFWSMDMNSFNHYAYGSIGDWMYKVIAGIDIDEENPGYKKIRIHPRPGGGISYAKASYHSLYGTIQVSWNISEAGVMTLDVTIPPNTSADVILPKQNAEGETQHLASGSYQFVYEY